PRAEAPRGMAPIAGGNRNPRPDPPCRLKPRDRILVPLHRRAGIAAIEPRLERIRAILQCAIETRDRLVRAADRIEQEPAIDPRLGAPGIGGNGAFVDRNGFRRFTAVDPGLGGITLGLEELRLGGEWALKAPESLFLMAGRA